MRATTPRLGYRPSLDGLRAIAVGFVLLDHALVAPFLGWGQVGVTLFFVLSGFLITTLLLEERHANGRIDLPAFYVRRALRLLPALLVLLVLVVLLMLAIGRAAEIPVDVLSTLFYVRNWFTAFGENPGLLSHAWSLSIEEQFYIGWPLLLIGLLRVSRGRLAPVIVTVLMVALASSVWRAVLWDVAGYNRALFGTDARIDSLLVGCCLGLLRWKVPVQVGAWVGMVALLAVATVSVIADDTGMAIWGITAINVAAAVLILASLDSRLLAWGPLVYVGTISYGLYLFHRPIARVFVDSGAGGELLAVLAIVALSFAMAWTSYRFVERPALRLKRYSQRRPASGLAGPPIIAVGDKRS
jgi:peptidoglycan/LPS O-acetylase OafA/YrhL